MIIKDRKGRRYQLLKKELRSMRPGKYIVKFNDINLYYGRSAQLYVRPNDWMEFGVYGFLNGERYIRVPITETAIGCRVFTKATMRKIKAAIKAAGKKAKR